MLSKPQSLLCLPMLYSHFLFRDIYLYQQDDMIKIFLLVNSFTEYTSTQTVAFPKAIMNLTNVGISDAFLKSHSSIIICVGSILHLVRLCCLYSLFDSLILRFKLYGRRRETVDCFWQIMRICEITCVYWIYFRMSLVWSVFTSEIYLVNTSL